MCIQTHLLHPFLSFLEISDLLIVVFITRIKDFENSSEIMSSNNE